MVHDLISLAKEITIDSNLKLDDENTDLIYESMALAAIDMYNSMPEEREMLMLATIVQLMVENLVLKSNV